MGSGAVRRLLIALLVLIGLLVAADRIGNYLAERAAASTLQQSQHLPSRPSVDIGGFPFLTQLIAHSFDEVTVTVDQVPVDATQHPFDLTQLHVMLHHLTVSGDLHRVQAQTVDGSVLLSYGQLSRALGVTVRPTSDGRVSASKQLTLVGTSVRASVTSRPTLSGHTLTFSDIAVPGLGQSTQQVVDALGGVFRVQLPLSGIPFQIQLTGLRMTSAGAVIGLQGHDLTYTR